MRSDSDVSPARPRKQHHTESQPPSSPVGLTTPTTFFLRSERDMRQSPTHAHQSSRQDRLEDSSFGVQSLEGTLEEAFPETTSPAPSASAHGGAERDAAGSRAGDVSNVLDRPPSSKKRKNQIHPMIAATAQRIISSDHSSSRTSSVSSTHPRRLSLSPLRGHLRSTSSTSRDQPFTSPRLISKPGSALSSTPRSGSVRSLALSDEDGSVFDDCGSQAIHSSDEEDVVEEDSSNKTSQVKAGAGSSPNVPQLVMPSLSMPKRRPFTDRGNNIGKLKVMIMGPSGVGKTCLIRSMLQSCDDIVHVDLNGVNSDLSSQLWRSGARMDREYTQTRQITEINASTKALPSWWSEMEEGRGLQRRRSIGGPILDRNLCFVDTPGWDNSGANEYERMQEVADEVVAYIEEGLKSNASMGQLGDSELLGSLSGGGGFQVDVLLYLFNPGKFLSEASAPRRLLTCCQARTHISPAELNLLRQLSSLTNLVPIIGKADSCSEDHVKDAKAALRATFDSAGIKIFAFNKDHVSSGERAPSVPYAVSSAVGDDSDVMDASLLMSPEYTQPLVASDLSSLAHQLFEPDNVQWLRHCAVKKFLRWRREHFSTPIRAHKNELHALSLGHSYLHSRRESIAASMVSDESSIVITRLPPYSDAPEPQDVQVAGWARDLQRALEAERCHHFMGYKACGQMTLRGTQGSKAVSQQKHRHKEQQRLREALGGVRGTRLTSTQDPLGVLALEEQLSRQGWLVLRILGGCSFFATVAVWMFRNWGVVTDLLGSRSETQIAGYGPGRDDWKAFFWGGRW